ncbi:unnamed protein product [Meganyctiphanes norvegica]|uniref:Cyclic GMP-AMP synthase n=1 Tax=Meganyctiphanes norvegica TaxID=48144 RepID=A0AAV2PQ32_MEGNR
MASNRNDDYVDEVLEELDDIQTHVQSKKHLLNEFLEDLKTGIENSSDCELLQGVHFRYPGSSYEHVGVTEKTDYDVALVLPQPYNAENFAVEKTRHGAGLYKLKWIGTMDKPDLININGYLKAIVLRDTIFFHLNDVIDEIKDDRCEDWDIRKANRKNSMLVILNGRNEDFTIKIDLVPQIQESSWEDTPDPPSDDDLPSVLREYVDQTRYPMFFSLASPATSPKDTDSYAAPYKLNRENDKHLIVSCSFSELEKHCLKSSKVVRNAVRLAKLVSTKYQWRKKFRLHSYHIKRIAIKHFDELDELSNWTAFQRLLLYLSDDVYVGHIDGFFIKNQDVYYEDDDEKFHAFAEAILQAKMSINPNNLRNLLTTN